MVFVLRQFHRWIGLAVCLFLISQGLTGATLVWKDDWLRALVPEARASVVSTTESFVLAARAAMKIPGARAMELAHPGLALHYVFLPKGGGLYIDQQGRPVANQVPGRFEHQLASFHAYLLLEHGIGGPIIGVLGVCLIFMSISGLIVWTSYRKSFRLRPLPASLARRDTLAAHRNFGVLVGVATLYMGCLGTGLAFREAILGGPMSPGSGHGPGPAARHVAGAPAPEIDWQKRLSALKTRFPDATPNLLFWLKGPSAPVLVTLRHGEAYRRGYTKAAVTADGKIINVRDARLQPWLVRAYDDFHSLHAAEVGGPAYKVVVSCIGLSLAFLGLTGGWSIMSKLADDLRRRRQRPGVAANAPLRLMVKDAHDVTGRVKRFELVSPDGSPLPPFTAGAHMDVRMPNGLIRSYSLLNPPSERHRYVIGVLRENSSRGGSAWMHDELSPGAEIEVEGPINNFELDDSAAEHLLIAGGIGITPLLSMAHALADKGARFRLLYCTRSRPEAAFADHIEEWFGVAAEFIHDDGIPGRGLDLSGRLAQRPDGAHLYVCGPRGFIDAARAAAEHWPPGTVHFEFFSAAAGDSTARDEPFDVELARSGRYLHVPANRSLLEVLRTDGMRVKTVCRAGVCGTCKTRVLAGVVDHRDEFLTDAERANWMQVCVSRAAPGQRLVLDL